MLTPKTIATVCYEYHHKTGFKRRNNDCETVLNLNTLVSVAKNNTTD